MLKKSTPYMLNKWGDLIEVKSGHHPYLLDSHSSAPISNQIEQLLKNRPEDLIWYYENTNNKSVSRDLITLLATVYGSNANSYEDQYGNFLIRLAAALNNQTDLSSVSCDGIQAEDLIKSLNDRVNEEFIRVRTSHMTMPSTANQNIYFRVGSKYTNWFDAIWKVIYKYKNWIDSVTIVTDLKSKGKEVYYKFGNKVADEMSTEEFLMLKGNPLVESLKYRIY